MVHTDSKSGAPFEQVTIDGDGYVVKYLHVDEDWIMRSSGDLRCRPLMVWQSGLLERMPASIDHAIVAASGGVGRHGWGAALLMRDVGAWLVPEGDSPVPLEQHRSFLTDMAELHAAYWDWHDDFQLMPPFHRYAEFAPVNFEWERAQSDPPLVPRLIDEGWKRFPKVAPRAAGIVLELLRDPTPLVNALGEAPQTLLHGDWKMGNLGSHPDGRTILLDWAVTGQGTPASELVWYLALNSARLPESKEATIAAYRGALSSTGAETDPWWQRSIELALLGGLVQFGWEKALVGAGDELGWWEDRAIEGAAWL